jgi:hypothetical protein
MPLDQKYKTKNYFSYEIIIKLLAILCVVYSLYIAAKYSNQALLDLYSFRQTQTALTAFWLVKNGFSLAYETPVAGPPWSIPFEFPIYQYIVALASQITNYPLDATGRAVSFIFLVLCLIPVRAITKQLRLNPSVFYVFTALLFSSPLYLYWGRTFMIETSAVFFSIVAIKCFIDIVQNKKSCMSSSLFLIFITLGILQKATTGLPVLVILSFVYLSTNVKACFLDSGDKGVLKSVFLTKKIMLALVFFGIPLAVGVVWTLYTDQIKTLNIFGVDLTSSVLNKWNWGTLGQRLSSKLFIDVIWKRIFEQNLSGVLGVAILVMALFSNVKNQQKFIVVISTLMGLVPLFLFTNLHIVHTYYQAANVIFLIFAIAVSLNHIANNCFEKKIILIALTIVMVASNYFWFSKEYLSIVKKEFTKENSQDFAVSDILKREIPEGKCFVAFGNDWSSSFAYLAERKSFTVPNWFKQYDKVFRNPEHFVDEAQLGAVVMCGKKNTINDLSRWSSENRTWKIGLVHDCYIALPEDVSSTKKLSEIAHTECEGSLDFVGESQDGKPRILSVTGWTTISGKLGILPDKVYVTLAKKNSDPMFYEALQVNRPDINVYFGKSNDADSGFSRIINTNSIAGEYVVGVARLNKGQMETCQFQKIVSLNGGIFNE